MLCPSTVQGGRMKAQKSSKPALEAEKAGKRNDVALVWVPCAMHFRFFPSAPRYLPGFQGPLPFVMCCIHGVGPYFHGLLLFFLFLSPLHTVFLAPGASFGVVCVLSFGFSFPPFISLFSSPPPLPSIPFPSPTHALSVAPQHIFALCSPPSYSSSLANYQSLSMLHLPLQTEPNADLAHFLPNQPA